MKFLIVDDVKPNCRVLEALLARYGESRVVHTGADALLAFVDGHARSAPFDLILLDVMLPGIDGLKVLEIVRRIEEAFHVAENQRVKIVMVSAVDRADVIFNAKKWGCDDYLIKPIMQKKLVESLQSIGLVPHG